MADHARRKRLYVTQDYERIVHSMLGAAVIITTKSEKSDEDSNCQRFVAHLRTEPVLLDAFFNSVAGYRAQFFATPSIDIAANSFIIEALIPVLTSAPHQENMSIAQRKLLELSLRHPWAKVWIHQGPWLLWSRRDQRMLVVQQWQTELTSTDKHRRKLSRWGSLVPTGQHFIVKGGFVCSNRHLLSGKTAEIRAKELHCLGFT